MADGPKKRGQREFVLRDSAAFLTLAAVAAIGLLLFSFAMPETGGARSSSVEPDIVLRDKSGAKHEGAFLRSAAE